MNNLDFWEHQAVDKFSTYPFLLEDIPLSEKFKKWLRLTDQYYEDFDGRIPAEKNVLSFYSTLTAGDKQSFEKYYNRAILQYDELKKNSKRFNSLLEIGPGLGFLGIPASEIDYYCYEKIDVVRGIRQFFYENINLNFFEIENLEEIKKPIDIVFLSNVLSEVSSLEAESIVIKISKILNENHGRLIIHDWFNPKTRTSLLRLLGQYFCLVKVSKVNFYPGHYSIVLQANPSFISRIHLFLLNIFYFDDLITLIKKLLR